MNPITRKETFLAAAAGEYAGELPEARTRAEKYWKKIVERIASGSGGAASSEQVDTAVENYLTSHGITDAKIQAWDSAEQNVPADWNAVSGDAVILNKPDLFEYDVLYAANTVLAANGSISIASGKHLADYNMLEIYYGQFQNGSSIAWASAKSFMIKLDNSSTLTKLSLVSYTVSSSVVTPKLFVLEPSVANDTITCTYGDGIRILRVIGYKQ